MLRVFATLATLKSVKTKITKCYRMLIEKI